ncbi:MAG: phosphodiester glycosidase family protein [Myxococcales bacterium]
MIHATVLLLAAVTLSAAPPPWQALALGDPDTVPEAVAFEWTERLPGFETAVLPARLSGQTVDRIHLVRVDPARYSFEARHDEQRPANIDAWQERLGALAVVNASFYQMDYSPETPMKTGGALLGPRWKKTRHGAFVAREGAADVVDLLGANVQEAIAPFSEAVVSYPLLLDASGKVRAVRNPNWIASRTIVAVDGRGRILLGTTETGFFSLRRLGLFLKAAPLGLKVALNMDGGPPACMAVKAGGFEETIRGRWEGNDSTGEFQMFWGAEEVDWPLPNVIAAVPRKKG